MTTSFHRCGVQSTKLTTVLEVTQLVMVQSQIDQVHGMTLVGTSQANKEASPVSTTDTESVGCLYLVKKDVVSFSIFFLIT